MLQQIPNYLKRDGSLAMTGGLNMNTQMISNLQTQFYPTCIHKELYR
jgi:hypothetical protein